MYVIHQLFVLILFQLGLAEITDSGLLFLPTPLNPSEHDPFPYCTHLYLSPTNPSQGRHVRHYHEGGLPYAYTRGVYCTLYHEFLG